MHNSNEDPGPTLFPISNFLMNFQIVLMVIWMNGYIVYAETFHSW